MCWGVFRSFAHESTVSAALGIVSGVVRLAVDSLPLSPETGALSAPGYLVDARTTALLSPQTTPKKF